MISTDIAIKREKLCRGRSSTIAQSFTLISRSSAELSVQGHKERETQRITADLIYDKLHTSVAFVG